MRLCKGYTIRYRNWDTDIRRAEKGEPCEFRVVFLPALQMFIELLQLILQAGTIVVNAFNLKRVCGNFGHPYIRI